MRSKENQSKPQGAATLDVAAIGAMRGGGAPLYMHVYRRLAQLIDSGALVEGARLPPSRFLAGQLALSRFTVAYAYELLAADGYTVGRGRAGTFVRRAATAPSRLLSPRHIVDPSGAMDRSDVAGEMLFSVGLAPMEFFPRKVWINLVKRRWTRTTVGDLLPGNPQGHLVLRRALANRLAITRGMACTPEQVFIVRGIAGATSLVAAAMVMPGDHVLVEDPAEPRCIDALDAAGAVLHRVPVDPHGMDVQAGLEAIRHPRLTVVTPSSQFPMGVALSHTRRALLRSAAAATGGYILEHDVQTDYRFAGSTVRSLASESGQNSVIHALHVSEIAFSALSISCVTVPPALVTLFREACERLPPPPSQPEQLALADLIRHGHLLRYFKTAFSACAARREALRAAFAEMGWRVYVPDAGLHLIVALDQPLDAASRTALQAHGLAPVSLDHYSMTGRCAPSLVVGFATVPEHRAREAVALLAKLIRPTI